MPCHITWTGERTHALIREALPRSPLFNGSIGGIGPRYCPSIEDKVVRFPERGRHRVVLEPETRDRELTYPNGLSTSLPFDVQKDIIASIPGLERAEILQLAMLQPKFAILDETDSGLDADAVRLASESIADIGHQKMGLLIITHHDKLLEHNPPQFTHVMLGGRIVETGGKELAEELHERGYDRIRKAYPEAEAANQEMVAEEVTA